MEDIGEHTTTAKWTPQSFFESFTIEPKLAALYRAQDALPEPVPCTNYPDAFAVEYGDPDYYTTVAYAKAMCAQCPIQQMCLDYAVENEVWNIWGGATATERARMQGKKKFVPNLTRRSVPAFQATKQQPANHPAEQPSESEPRSA